jgi:hypothetical protein
VGRENRSILQGSVKYVLHIKVKLGTFVNYVLFCFTQGPILRNTFHWRTTRLSACSFCSLGLRSIIFRGRTFKAFKLSENWGYLITGPSFQQSVKESESKSMGWVTVYLDRDEVDWLDFVRKFRRRSSIKLQDWDIWISQSAGSLCEFICCGYACKCGWF